MKFAFCTEDESDDAIACDLMKRVCGLAIERDGAGYRIPKGGWTQALRLAPAVARHAFNGGLAGAVFMIDNDGTRPEHAPVHDEAPVEGCRLCDLRAAAKTRQVESWNRAPLAPLAFIFAVPVETLESWLLLSSGIQPREIANLGRMPSQRRELKRRLYGTDLPHRARKLETASSIIADLDIAALEAKSASFGYLVKQLQRIAAQNPPA